MHSFQDHTEYILEMITHTWILFFTKYVLQYCLICCWINLQVPNHIYRGLAVKLYLDIQLCEWWASLTLTLFKGQLYIVYAYTYTHIYPYTYGYTISSHYSW